MESSTVPAVVDDGVAAVVQRRPWLLAAGRSLLIGDVPWGAVSEASSQMLALVLDRHDQRTRQPARPSGPSAHPPRHRGALSPSARRPPQRLASAESTVCPPSTSVVDPELGLRAGHHARPQPVRLAARNGRRRAADGASALLRSRPRGDDPRTRAPPPSTTSMSPCTTSQSRFTALPRRRSVHAVDLLARALSARLRPSVWIRRPRRRAAGCRRRRVSSSTRTPTPRRLSSAGARARCRGRLRSRQERSRQRRGGARPAVATGEEQVGGGPSGDGGGATVGATTLKSSWRRRGRGQRCYFDPRLSEPFVARDGKGPSLREQHGGDLMRRQHRPGLRDARALQRWSASWSFFPRDGQIRRRLWRVASAVRVRPVGQ